MKLRSLTLTVFSLLGTLAIAASHNARPYDAKVFDWESITPSSDLEYHDCDGKFQCARLILPMDWLNQKNSDNITIAIRKFPAAVGDDDPTFGGTVFAQPGGPAASGTRYNLGIGPVLQNVLDRPGKKHYEILSFDIRGVGYSTPKVDCFPGLLSYLRGLESLVNGVADLSPSALAFSLAEVKADWQQCYKMCGDFLSYTSSANIARDMVGILDKIEELRRRNAHGREPIGDTTHGNSRLELRSDTSYEEGSKLRLQYIGISYGTVFGNTFASMFPGRVGRMVLDGVMDVNDVVYGPGWFNNTQDTDTIADLFFKGCFEAGESLCPLIRSSDKSGADLSHRFWKWTDNLDEHPLVIPTVDGHRQFIRAGDVRSLFLWALYNPVLTYRPLAAAFDDAMLGRNMSGLLERHLEISQIYPPKDGMFVDYSADPIIDTSAQTAVLCADGENVTETDNAYWCDYVAKQVSISSVAGEFWARLRMSCAGWKSRPNWVFRGPFTTPKATGPGEALQPGRPAAPLLFASNRYDPVTPLRNARRMAESHPGAGVLVQEVAGHCLVLGAMGPCAKEALAEYFDTGVVPGEEKICQAALGPWDPEPEVGEMGDLEHIWRGRLRQFTV